MASEFGAVSASQVASHFVQQYYHILQQKPDEAFRFYNESSSMNVVDGEITKSASDIGLIHNLIMSLQFASIEIKTISSEESWNRGVFLVVSGSVASENFSGRRKFVQSFFLAPQVRGYFVLNDVFHLLDEEVISQSFVSGSGVSVIASEPPTPVVVEDEVEVEVEAEAEAEVEAEVEAEAEAEAETEVEATISSLQDTPVHTAEEEARIYVDADHSVRDHTIEGCSFQEHQQDENYVHVSVEEKTLEEPSEIVQIGEDPTRGTLASEEKTDGEQEKPSYASILRAARGQPRPTVRVVQSVLPPQKPIQQSNPVTTPNVADESPLHREGHSKIIYVRNLPSSATTLEVLDEFKTFGRVKQDGVYLVNNKGVGVCYAFVEFEDVQGAQNAVKASPIKLGGKQVYIEMRKSNSYGGSRGGRTGRGRGRAGRLGGRSGRRSFQEGIEINHVGSNGFGDA